MATRIGVDVGGTFTDLVAYDDRTGEIVIAKGPSTPEAPDRGVVAVVTEPGPRAVLEAAEFFLHGTTVGINSLLERKGAVVGLLTTAGFRDVLELRRGTRDEMYNPVWRPAEPLVPRRLRVPVRERIRATGATELALNEDDVRAAAAFFAEEGVEAVGIVFLNSYANPAHELRAAELLREAGFEGAISVSAEVSGEYREYERTSTVTLDAFVRPKVSSYLRRLEQSLGENGFTGDCLVTRSGGGAMHFGIAEGRPFETIMSGPVAGAVGTGSLCRQLGIAAAITADVGGTSFDTCLVLDGRPQLKYEGSVLGMPIQSPWVDVRSIGAGGGSIAFVDEGGLLRVGPRSAGAVPGPICYGRGGEQPTVTDAAAVLGMLGPGRLAGGIVLDIAAAAEAIEQLGEKIGLGVQETAQGIMRIAASAMADAIRSVTVEQGEDPRDAALVAFGGAGPLFGSLLAEELQISKIVVPRYAGNFSAWALLGQDVTRTMARTCLAKLDADAAGTIDAVSADLFTALEADSDGDAPIREVALDLRYEGQEHALTVDVDVDAAGKLAAEPGKIEADFTTAYERAFGHGLPEPVQVVAVRVTSRELLPEHDAPVVTAAEATENEPVEAYSARLGTVTTFAVLDRDTLAVGSTTAGPAIVLEPTATTYVDSGERIVIDPTGHMIVERVG
jgi:N-methylhydantoinase A